MALTRWQAPALRHGVAQPGRVTWLELFFDLIYVAALIQLGDRLSDDVSWEGVGRFVGTFVILWWTWTGTTAFVNRFSADDVVHRLLTFAQMFAVGTFAIVASSTTVDDPTAWMVAAYLGARLPLLVMYLRARRATTADPIIDLYLRAFGAGVVLWAASLAVPEEWRPVVWAVALVVEFSAPIVGARRGTSRAPIHEEHFRERYALFTIIVLGETFVKTLSEVVEIGMSAQTTVFGGLSFVMLVALWWTYFDDVAGSELAPRSRLGARPSTNRLWWVYLHLPLAAGLTAFGVAAKKLVGVDAFDASFTESYTWLLVGAVSVVLVAVALLDVVTVSPHFGVRTGAQVALRLAAVGAVLVTGALTAGGSVSAIVGAAAMAVILVAQIGGEIAIALRADERVTRTVGAFVGEGGGTCEHLAGVDEVPRAGDGCETCEEVGLAWVQLRRCLTCGHVACCDDSPGRHATAHHRSTGHPAVATLQPGDDWAYCYVDEIVDEGWWRDRIGTSPR